MSRQLDVYIEVKVDDKWQEHEFVHREPLGYDYAVFSYDARAFFTGYRNHEMMPTIGEDKMWRGSPKDSNWLDEPYPDGWPGETQREYIFNDCCTHVSYLTLAELLEFDYDQKFENRENTNRRTFENWDNHDSVPEGEGHEDTLRNALGETFFHGIDYLKELGDPENVRVLFNLS